MNRILKLTPGSEPAHYLAERAISEAKRVPRLPEGLHRDAFPLGGITGERVFKIGGTGPMILYIHGGGFTHGSARQRREITYYLADTYGCMVYANNYRLSPEHKFPCHLQDCTDYYLHLLRTGINPSQLILMGESAGATLSLSLCLWLKKNHLPLPGAICAFSPLTNFAGGFPSQRLNAGSDYLLRDTINSMEQIATVFSDTSTKKQRQNPLISPYFGDYTGLPPIFLSASDTETLYDDAVKLYEKLKATGHPCKLDIRHDCPHAYAMFPKLPEARATIEQAMEFIQKYTT